jgi:hypothetical protein
VRGQFLPTRNGFPHSAGEFRQVVHHQSIRNPQQAFGDSSQKISFRRGFPYWTGLRVITTVKLDRPATFEAVEIDNPIFQAARAAKSCAQLSAPQQVPRRSFSVRLAAPQFAEAFG